MEKTKFSFCAPVDWNGVGCKKEHVVIEGNYPNTLCGRKLTRRRFDLGQESGDIASQKDMDDLSSRGFLSHSVCQTCIKSMIKLASKHEVTVDPVTWVI